MQPLSVSQIFAEADEKPTKPNEQEMLEAEVDRLLGKENAPSVSDIFAEADAAEGPGMLTRAAQFVTGQQEGEGFLEAQGRGFKAIGEAALGGAEAVGSAVTGLGGAVIGGLASIPGFFLSTKRGPQGQREFSIEPEQALRIQHKIGEFLTYRPKTRFGRALIEPVNEFIGKNITGVSREITRTPIPLPGSGEYFRLADLDEKVEPAVQYGVGMAAIAGPPIVKGIARNIATRSAMRRFAADVERTFPPEPPKPTMTPSEILGEDMPAAAAAERGAYKGGAGQVLGEQPAGGELVKPGPTAAELVEQQAKPGFLKSAEEILAERRAVAEPSRIQAEWSNVREQLVKISEEVAPERPKVRTEAEPTEPLSVSKVLAEAEEAPPLEAYEPPPEATVPMTGKGRVLAEKARIEKKLAEPREAESLEELAFQNRQAAIRAARQKEVENELRYVSTEVRAGETDHPTRPTLAEKTEAKEILKNSESTMTEAEAIEIARNEAGKSRTTLAQPIAPQSTGWHKTPYGGYSNLPIEQIRRIAQDMESKGVKMDWKALEEKPAAITADQAQPPRRITPESNRKVGSVLDKILRDESGILRSEFLESLKDEFVRKAIEPYLILYEALLPRLETVWEKPLKQIRKEVGDSTSLAYYWDWDKSIHVGQVGKKRAGLWIKGVSPHWQFRLLKHELGHFMESNMLKEDIMAMMDWAEVEGYSLPYEQIREHWTTKAKAYKEDPNVKRASEAVANFMEELSPGETAKALTWAIKRTKLRNEMRAYREGYGHPPTLGEYQRIVDSPRYKQLNKELKQIIKAEDEVRRNPAFLDTATGKILSHPEARSHRQVLQFLEPPPAPLWELPQGLKTITGKDLGGITGVRFDGTGKIGNTEYLTFTDQATKSSFIVNPNELTEALLLKKQKDMQNVWTKAEHHDYIAEAPETLEYGWLVNGRFHKHLSDAVSAAKNESAGPIPNEILENVSKIAQIIEEKPKAPWAEEVKRDYPGFIEEKWVEPDGKIYVRGEKVDPTPEVVGSHIERILENIDKRGEKIDAFQKLVDEGKDADIEAVRKIDGNDSRLTSATEGINREEGLIDGNKRYADALDTLARAWWRNKHWGERGEFSWAPKRAAGEKAHIKEMPMDVAQLLKNKGYSFNAASTAAIFSGKVGDVAKIEGRYYSITKGSERVNSFAKLAADQRGEVNLGEIKEALLRKLNRRDLGAFVEGETISGFLTGTEKTIAGQKWQSVATLEGNYEWYPAAALKSQKGAISKDLLMKIPRTVAEFFVPMLNLPKSAEYMLARYGTMGKINIVEAQVKKTWKELGKWPIQTRKDVFRFLDGQVALGSLPANVQAMARRMQIWNQSIGKALVKRGMLSEEAFEAHKGQYVRYLYLRHILGDDVHIGTSGGRLDMTYLKMRKDLTTEQRAALGLIEDVSVAEPMTLSKSLSDIVKWDLYDKISRNPDWTWQPSIVQIGKRRLGIGALEAEIKAYREVNAATPGVPEIQAALKRLESAYEEAKAHVGKAPKDYHRIPDSKHYGPMRGTYVHKSIADDIIPVWGGVGGTTPGAQIFNWLVKMEERGMAAFKVSKVALNVPTMTRNFISNIIQLNMSGTNIPKVFYYMEKALESAMKKDGNWQIARRNGLFKTNWAESEIAEVLKIVKDYRPTSWFKAVDRLAPLAKFYGRIDDFFKLTKFLEQRANGATVATATLEAQKWAMDYSLTNPTVKLLRRHVVPFGTYTYKITPLIAESLYKRPWVIGKFAALIPLSYELFKYTNNINDYQWKKLAKMLPSYIKKTGSYAVLPMRNAEGEWRWVNLEYFFPWQNFRQAADDIMQKSYGELPQDIGIGNPYFTILGSLAMSKGDNPPVDLWTRKDIYSRVDKPSVKAQKMVEWLYAQWAPPMMTRFGALGWTFSIGDKTKTGHKITPGEAAVRWFGANINAVSPAQRGMEIKGKKALLSQALRRIIRDQSVPTEKKREAIETYKRLILELVKE